MIVKEPRSIRRRAASSRVLVLGPDRQPLMPCGPARARQLLRSGRAGILRHYPLVIILRQVSCPTVTQPVRLSLDPGSYTTGIAVASSTSQGDKVVWAAHLEHRGRLITRLLAKRRACRSHRRSRKTRYRAARFQNRSFSVGWLPPSTRSNADRTLTWVNRLRRWSPVSHLAVELPKFDTQKKVNPRIAGADYLRGPLAGTTKRDYVVDQWQGKCAYCDEQVSKIELEHVIPRSRGGGQSVKNLVLACPTCNQRKGKRTAEEFGFPHLQQSHLRDAGVMNAIRWHLWHRLDKLGLPLETSVGKVTKRNRVRMGYPKADWIDAASIGAERSVRLDPAMSFWRIKSHRRHSRCMTLIDKYGFPKSKPKTKSVTHEFLTGDFVRAVVPRGRNKGTHVGRVVVQARGYFMIGPVINIWHRYCRILQRRDGYDYSLLRASKDELHRSAPGGN
jgi:5-methylcytosine-specific restriction endonuclease McrA